MKQHSTSIEYDATDLEILEALQHNCKQPLAEIGKQVGLSAPSVVERIKKLEESGVIRGYAALLDARLLGRDVTAFIGVSISHPSAFEPFEKEIERSGDVLECHHVTGQHTLMLKVRTETMVVLSTRTERTRVALDAADAPLPRRRRSSKPRSGDAT